MCGKFNNVVCTKSSVQSCVSNKSVCNYVFNNLDSNTNKRNASINTISPREINLNSSDQSTSDQEHVKSESCADIGTVLTSSISVFICYLASKGRLSFFANIATDTSI